ncbi:MAG: AraC family transcriptional regulator ligand-binding domain-containing protein, partial [Pseudomonadota bacterium]
MDRDPILKVLMTNTYARMLTQDFVDHVQLLNGVGIEPIEFVNYSHPITVQQHLRCVSNALSMKTETDWHLRWGRRMAGNFHGPITMAMVAAPTLGEGLDAMLRYVPARVPYLGWQGIEEGEGFRVELDELIDLGDTRCALVEVPLLILHDYVSVFNPDDFNKASVELKYQDAEHQSEYSKWFKCHVTGGVASNAFVLPKMWRALQNLDFDESAWLTALQRCETTYGDSQSVDLLS